MILKSFKQFIKEDWVSTVGLTKSSVDVFVNPSSKELKEIYENGVARFIIDVDEKKIYMFNGHKFTHFTIIKQLKLEGKLAGMGHHTDLNFNKYLTGHTKSDGLFYSDTITSDVDSAIDEENKSWKNKLIKKFKLLQKENLDWCNKYIGLEEINKYINQQLEKLNA